MTGSGPTAADRVYVEAMRAEVNWAPLHFNGWSHYEQARPTMPEETIEVIARWPDLGYTLQYRPLLGELTEARQYPIDMFPTVTVLGRVQESDLARLRSHAAAGDDLALGRSAREVAMADRTIPTEPPVRTGSSIPEYEEIPVHYLPMAGRLIAPNRPFDDSAPSRAYSLAGSLGLRLGRPVGLTPMGRLVFQPVGVGGVRLTLPDSETIPFAIYRYEGLGCWRQTLAVADSDEVVRLLRGDGPIGTSQTRSRQTRVVPSPL